VETRVDGHAITIPAPPLGIDYIPLEDSVIDMGKALIATGYIPPAATAAAS